MTNESSSSADASSSEPRIVSSGPREQHISIPTHDNDDAPATPRARRSPWRLKPLDDARPSEPYAAVEMTNISTAGGEADGLHVVADSSAATDPQQGGNNNNDSKHHSPHHAHPQELDRHLSLLDLVSVGVGGTIGSGIFVLCGLIAHEHAGPATCLSWGFSGLAALLSGCCYAELSGRIPSAGSSYAYAYASMGELPAFLTAACLTLEFLVSGSAVARSWGDKVVEWLTVEIQADGDWVQRYLNPGAGLNPMAFVVSALSTVINLCGVRESKLMTDFFTWAKVGLVVFMTLGGFILWDVKNLQPFVPSEFGFSGIVRGATTSFFGYLGFDGICCVAGEAKNPTMNLPKSIMITLALVTVLYISAALALVGMLSYTEISSESAFPEAFHSRGAKWAAQFTVAGEIFTLPVVVWLSVMIQPRLQYALAKDGLLPPMFCEVDNRGILYKGSLFAGSIMTLIAAFVPFAYLDDFISAGILCAFSVTNSSLVVMRLDSPEHRPFLLEKLLATFNLLCFLSCLVLCHGDLASKGTRLIALCFVLATVWNGYVISKNCPACQVFGGSRRRAVGTTTQWDTNVEYFRTPFVPLVPLLGTFVNWYLVADLEILGILLLLLYFGVVVFTYYHYASKLSARSYQVVHGHLDHSEANREAYEGESGIRLSNGVQRGQPVTDSSQQIC